MSISTNNITMNGVIDTATGDLLRAGFCDFTLDGSFNPGTETYRTDVPFPSKVKGSEYELEFHQWDGLDWILVIMP